MRSPKRYTNVTFTRRVDHDGGRRPARAPKEPIVCAGCGATYVKRRWTHEPAGRVKAAAGRPITVRICAGCRHRTGGTPHGFVHLDGTFVAEHLADLRRLIENEAARAREDNPTAQTIEIGGDGLGGLIVTTTTEHLAVRLGRAIEKAFRGRLVYGFSHENKLAHVWWHRDAA